VVEFPGTVDECVHSRTHGSCLDALQWGEDQGLNDVETEGRWSLLLWDVAKVQADGNLLFVY